MLLMAASTSHAEIEAGAKTAKSAGCAGCHGINGLATSPQYPNLAGQNAAYLASALKAYQDGTRSDPVMRAMVHRLSADEILDLADYYAGNE